MSAITPLHIYTRELNILIEDEIERLKELLSAGLLENHSEYKYIAGKVRGLRQAVDYIGEADRLCKMKIL